MWVWQCLLVCQLVTGDLSGVFPYLMHAGMGSNEHALYIKKQEEWVIDVDPWLPEEDELKSREGWVFSCGHDRRDL